MRQKNRTMYFWLPAKLAGLRQMQARLLILCMKIWYRKGIVDQRAGRDGGPGRRVSGRDFLGYEQAEWYAAQTAGRKQGEEAGMEV